MCCLGAWQGDEMEKLAAAVALVAVLEAVRIVSVLLAPITPGIPVFGFGLCLVHVLKLSMNAWASSNELRCCFCETSEWCCCVSLSWKRPHTIMFPTGSISLVQN